MNQIGGTKDTEGGEAVSQSMPLPQEVPKGSELATVSAEEQQEVSPEEKPPQDHPMEEDSVSPATVFTIRLKQSKSNLLHKMSVPELCRNFRSVKF